MCWVGASFAVAVAWNKTRIFLLKTSLIGEAVVI
jgi:hypothetical protein